LISILDVMDNFLGPGRSLVRYNLWRRFMWTRGLVTPSKRWRMNQTI